MLSGSGASEHLSGERTDPYLEGDRCTSIVPTGIARYALADAASLGSWYSIELQQDITSSGSESHAAVLMYVYRLQQRWRDQ